MEEPLEMPDRPGTVEMTWVQDSVVSGAISPFTLTEQVYAWPGQRWSVVLKLPPMQAEDALAWQAFFGELNGREGTFWVKETAHIREPGIGYGTPELDGAHASGSTVKTRGWTPEMRVLRKGQKIEIGQRLRQVLDDVYSGADGKAQVRCWPHCRDLPDSLRVEWYGPRGVFRLAEVPGFVWKVNRLQDGFQFSASEAILP